MLSEHISDPASLVHLLGRRATGLPSGVGSPLDGLDISNLLASCGTGGGGHTEHKTNPHSHHDEAEEEADGPGYFPAASTSGGSGSPALPADGQDSSASNSGVSVASNSGNTKVPFNPDSAPNIVTRGEGSFNPPGGAPKPNTPVKSEAPGPEDISDNESGMSLQHGKSQKNDDNNANKGESSPLDLLTSPLGGVL